MNPSKKKRHGVVLAARWKRVFPPAIGVIFSVTIFVLLLSLVTGSNEMQNDLSLNRTGQDGGIILQTADKAPLLSGMRQKAETPDFACRWLLQTHRVHRK